MAVLRMKVTTATMPPSPEFFAVVKAVERFYYALLASTEAAYSGRPEPWWSWVEQGFSAAIRQAPPETRERDALATSVRSDGKVIEVTAVSINDELLEEVGGLLAAASADQSGDPGDGGDRRPPFDMAGSSVSRNGLWRRCPPRSRQAVSTGARPIGSWKCFRRCPGAEVPGHCLYCTVRQCGRRAARFRSNLIADATEESGSPRQNTFREKNTCDLPGHLGRWPSRDSSRPIRRLYS